MSDHSHARNFFGYLNGTLNRHLLHRPSSPIHSANATVSEHSLRTNLLPGSRSANFGYKIVSTASHTGGPYAAADRYFGYDVEQFSYILIASGLLGSVTFVAVFYIVMACRKVYVKRRNARWNALGCEVYLVHWPDMPRSTTDVFIGNAGFPPLVPPEPRDGTATVTVPVVAPVEGSTVDGGDVLADRAFIQLTPNDAQATLTKLQEAVHSCTSTAKYEMQRLDELELAGFRQALIDFAESQIQAAQESYEILLEQIRRIQEWYPEPSSSPTPTVPLEQ
ncbi:hypothetical protein BV898_11286 [Hypsibius exemplaris]|uniref:Uncharacterized protein n=1 Tax=Hypsibius exemplaris TaxID=2072580 RepID=A0A1W0WH88_HYPEX|nr:hypothetical protein BV898_11286 [Hypsibius exemplaris]